MSEVQTPTWRLETWFPNLDPKAIQKMKKYHDIMESSNRTMSLVSAKTLPFADALHFGDSILAGRAVLADRPDIKELYDLGSGSGFPGLVMAIMYPQIQFVLIDSDIRKTEFLKQVISSCEIMNARASHELIEKIPDDRITFCINRGLASLSKSILMARKCVKLGGVFYHLKGETWPNEIAEIPTQLCGIWSPSLVAEYKLPIGPMKFAVVKTTKIA